MRIAIVSSPRSGNTWLRHLLRDGLELQEVAVHNYSDCKSIPERCVLQLHWYREPNFQRFLSENGFKVISVARHPLDILVSVLHFVRYEPETAKWLGGNCELPSFPSKCSPASEEFVQYSLSFGSENLLSVTYQWWHDHSVIKTRYEDLVTATAAQATRLAGELSVSPEGMIEASARNSLETFKALPNRHGWQGTPGLWEKLIPFESAVAIFDRHRRVFEKLGYAVHPTALTCQTAEANWVELSR